MRLPDPALPFEAQTADVLLAMCIFGEARGESEAVRRGVAQVVRNRVRDREQRYGRGWHGVILKKWQFSCFLPADPNRAKLLRPQDYESPQVWRGCWKIAQEVYFGHVADNTGGATHYFDDSMTDNPPRWARQFAPTVKLGRLNFFRTAG